MLSVRVFSLDWTLILTDTSCKLQDCLIQETVDVKHRSTDEIKELRTVIEERCWVTDIAFSGKEDFGYLP